MLTDGRANGHLTLELSGARGVGFHILRYQTSSLKWHAFICLLPFVSLGLLRKTTLVANKVLINIIVQIHASCEKYLVIHMARIFSVVPRAARIR